MESSQIVFRCSSLGKIMTEPKELSNLQKHEDAIAHMNAAKKDETKAKYKAIADSLEPIKNEVLLSETCKTYLVEKGIEERYGRSRELVNKFVKKGLQAEDDAITLYSRLKKEFFTKNEFNLSNRYISGTPDLYTGPIIHEAETIIDIKCSWDVFTYFKATTKDLNKQYYWQLQGYMALTGAQKAILAYCLIDTPQPLVYQELKQLEYKFGNVSPTDKSYILACEEVERLAKYDDVPMHERVTEIEIDRNNADIERIYERVKECRKWMNENLFKTLHSANVG